jgi:hypothetical protein
MDRRAFIIGGVATLATPLAAAAQQPPPPPGLVCPGNTYWTGHGCTSGRRPPAEGEYVEIVPERTTKKEILALFGGPDYRWTHENGNEELIYYIQSLGPPYPTWFRDRSLRDRSGMLVFRVDQRGIFIGYHLTSPPTP